MYKRNPKLSNYNYDDYKRPLTEYELKSVGEITLLYEYRRLKGGRSNAALPELIKRHDNLLRVVAKNNNKLFNLSSDYEDKLQHARYAAMRSYDKFDIDMAREKKYRLYNYVSNSAMQYLHTSNDNDSFIRCPPNQRLTRSYISGKFDLDTEKKNNIEKKLGIRTEEDKNDLKLKYSNLNVEYCSTDVCYSDYSDSHNDNLGETLPCESFDIDSNIDIYDLINSFGPIKREIIKKVYIDGYTMEEAASLLGISFEQVRSSISGIKRKLKSLAVKEPTVL